MKMTCAGARHIRITGVAAGTGLTGEGSGVPEPKRLRIQSDRVLDFQQRPLKSCKRTGYRCIRYGVRQAEVTRCTKASPRYSQNQLILQVVNEFHIIRNWAFGK